MKLNVYFSGHCCHCSKSLTVCSPILLLCYFFTIHSTHFYIHCVKAADIEAAGKCIISSLYIYCFFRWNCLQQQTEFMTLKFFSKGAKKNIWNGHLKFSISKWMWDFNCQYSNEVVASHLSDLFLILILIYFDFLFIDWLIYCLKGLRSVVTISSCVMRHCSTFFLKP